MERGPIRTRGSYVPASLPALLRAVRVGNAGALALSAVLEPIHDAFARRGNRVTCTCCGESASRFTPYGVPPVANARCPHCHALVRHRVLAPYLRNLVQPGSRVLHFAPEPAIARTLLDIQEIAYTPADLDPNDRTLGDNVAVVPADITQQPWPDRSFDIAVVSHVLEHVPDDLAAMRELGRVVGPSGVVVSQHPYNPRLVSTFEDSTVVTPADRQRVFGQWDHVRIYGRDLPDRWRRAGFDVTLLHGDAPPGSQILEARLES